MTVLVTEESPLGLATTAYSAKGVPMTRRYFSGGSVYSFDCTPLMPNLAFERQKPFSDAPVGFMFVEWVGAQPRGEYAHLDLSLRNYKDLATRNIRETDVIDIPVAAFYGVDRTVVFSYTVTRRRFESAVRTIKFDKNKPDDLLRVVGLTPPLLKMTTSYPKDSAEVVRKEITFLNSDKHAMPNAVRTMRRATITSSWVFVRDFLYGYSRSETVGCVYTDQMWRYQNG